MRGFLFVGVAIAAGPALTALVGPGEVNPDRIATALVFGTIGIALVVAGWPRLRRTSILLAEGVIEPEGGARGALGPSPTLCLSAGPPRSRTGPARYAVALRRSEGPPLVLVSETDPAATLRSLERLATHLPWPVEPGWGLPDGNPWTGPRRDPDAEPAAPPEDDWVDQATRRRVATTLVVGALGVATVLAFELSGRIASGDQPSTLSLALPCFALIATLVLAGRIGTEEVQVEVQEDRVVGVWRSFGRVRRRQEVRRADVRRAFAVSPTGAGVRHLLLDTAHGPVALPSTPTDCSRLLARLGEPA